MILTDPKVLWAWFFNVSTPFHLVPAAAAAAAVGVESQSCFYEAEYRLASSLWVGGGAVSKYLVAFKSLMGLQPFDVRIFF